MTGVMMKTSGALLGAIVTIGTIGSLGLAAPAATAATAVAPAGCYSLPALVATVRVGTDKAAEYFRIRVDDPAEIRKVCANYDGSQGRTHPNGLIVYAATGEAHENTGYSWYLRDVHMADMSTEVCDGRPSDVERHTLTSTRYCPWSSRVVAVRA